MEGNKLRCTVGLSGFWHTLLCMEYGTELPDLRKESRWSSKIVVRAV